MLNPMKTCTLLAAVAALALVAASAWGINIGNTKEETIAELGRPIGTGKRGGSEFLYYGGGVVEIKNGKVASLDGSVSVYAVQTAKGLVQLDGRWVTPEKKKAVEDERRAAAALGPKVKDIAQGGKKVELRELVVPGKITIVNFYADWCGPCHAMAPELEALTKENPDIFLRKVDIVNWDSDVAKQYDLHSIPNVRVYDRKGKQVGDATHDMADIVKNTTKAK
jgi:thiol-disulfide isomerase/thioredoxin